MKKQTVTGLTACLLLMSAVCSCDLTNSITDGGKADATYNVFHSGNGNTSGTVPVDTGTYAAGAAVTVKGNTGGLAKTGYVFAAGTRRPTETGPRIFRLRPSPWEARTLSCSLNGPPHPVQPTRSPTTATGTPPARSRSTVRPITPAPTYVYAVGIQNSNISFNYDGLGVTGPYNGGNAVLVQFMTASGNIPWVKTATTASSDTRFQAVAVDPSGNVFAAGYQSGNGSFDYGSGNVTGSSSVSVNSVLVKYDSSGTALWARTPSYNSASYSAYTGVAVDSWGNAYVGGYQNNTYLFT